MPSVSTLGIVDASAALSSCLGNAGFEVTLEDDVFVGVGINAGVLSDERFVLYQEALLACGESLAEAGLISLDDASDAQLRVRFEFLLEARNCLIDNGYPANDAPSVEVYIDSGGLWSPYQLLMMSSGKSRDEIEDAFRSCPQI